VVASVYGKGVRVPLCSPAVPGPRRRAAERGSGIGLPRLRGFGEPTGDQASRPHRSTPAPSGSGRRRSQPGRPTASRRWRCAISASTGGSRSPIYTGVAAISSRLLSKDAPVVFEDEGRRTSSISDGGGQHPGVESGKPITRSSTSPGRLVPLIDWPGGAERLAPGRGLKPRIATFREDIGAATRTSADPLAPGLRTPCVPERLRRSAACQARRRRIASTGQRRAALRGWCADAERPFRRSAAQDFMFQALVKAPGQAGYGAGPGPLASGAGTSLNTPSSRLRRGASEERAWRPFFLTGSTTDGASLPPGGPDLPRFHRHGDFPLHRP
jgi:hypothetical protein